MNNVFIASDQQPFSGNEHDPRTPEETGISEKWKPLASLWLGSEAGEHCHWCKHIVEDDGTVECGNPDSEIKGRIRTWDGEGCARRCKIFELLDRYKSDKNHDEYFKKTEEVKP